MRPALLACPLACLLTLGIAGPAAAEWRYEPPPLGAVVTYDDGRVSEIVTAEGETIVLEEVVEGGQEVHAYRTWLLQASMARPSMGVTLTLDTGEGSEVAEAWPLQPGESIDLPYRVRNGEAVLAEGELTATYEGEETLEVPAGSFTAHKLVHDLTFRRADGGEVRTLQSVWHDAATGLILRLDFETWQPEGSLEGSRVATEIQLP